MQLNSQLANTASGRAVSQRPLPLEFASLLVAMCAVPSGMFWALQSASWPPGIAYCVPALWITARCAGAFSGDWRSSILTLGFLTYLALEPLGTPLACEILPWHAWVSVKVLLGGCIYTLLLDLLELPRRPL
jgi:hypothetical protein